MLTVTALENPVSLATSFVYAVQKPIYTATIILDMDRCIIRMQYTRLFMTVLVASSKSLTGNAKAPRVVCPSGPHCDPNETKSMHE